MLDLIKLCIRLKMIMLSLSLNSNKEMTKLKELKTNLNNSKTQSLKWNLLTTVLTSKQLKTNSKLKRTFHLSTIKSPKESNFHPDWTKSKQTFEFNKINLTLSFHNNKNWEDNILWTLIKIKIWTLKLTDFLHWLLNTNMLINNLSMKSQFTLTKISKPERFLTEEKSWQILLKAPEGKSL